MSKLLLSLLIAAAPVSSLIHASSNSPRLPSGLHVPIDPTGGDEVSTVRSPLIPPVNPNSSPSCNCRQLPNGPAIPLFFLGLAAATVLANAEKKSPLPIK